MVSIQIPELADNCHFKTKSWDFLKHWSPLLLTQMRNSNFDLLRLPCLIRPTILAANREIQSESALAHVRFKQLRCPTEEALLFSFITTR